MLILENLKGLRLLSFNFKKKTRKMMSKINPNKQRKEIINKNTKNKNRNKWNCKEENNRKKINEAKRFFFFNISRNDKFQTWSQKRQREKFQIINTMNEREDITIGRVGNIERIMNEN